MHTHTHARTHARMHTHTHTHTHTPHDDGDGVWLQVEADAEKQLHALMSYLAQSVGLSEIEVEVSLYWTVPLVDYYTSVPVAAVCVRCV